MKKKKMNPSAKIRKNGVENWRGKAIEGVRVQKGNENIGMRVE